MTPTQVATQQGHQHVVEAIDAMAILGPRVKSVVVDALEASKDRRHQNLGADLRCPISFEPYTTRGMFRPVRLPDGATETGQRLPGSVLCATAARKWLDAKRADPLTRTPLDAATVRSFLASDAFRRGDPERLRLVERVQQACAHHTGMDPQALCEAAAGAAAAHGADGPRGPAAAGTPHYLQVLEAAAAPPSARAAHRSADHPIGGP